jgi:hypothetical protein
VEAQNRPSLVMEARVREVDVTLVVEVEVVGEVQAHALGLRGERRGQPALGANLEQAEVSVGDVEVHSALVETEPEGAAADVWYSSSDALGPPQTSWDQRGDVVAKVAHRAPSQTTTRPSATPV